MQTDTIDDAGMAFGVVNDDIMPAYQCIDGRKDTLVAKIDQQCGFFAYKSAGGAPVRHGIWWHQTSAVRPSGRQAPVFGCLRIRFRTSGWLARPR
ncbi:MAG: hypothetical protein R2806_23740 [Saprospiraceae bacterium]